MGLLDIFSGKDPEDLESKGDKLAETGAYGKAIAEYERALQRLEKTAPWDEGYRQSLRDKIQTGKEALARQHQKTAADMLEAGFDGDALQYIQLALDLTEDPDLTNDLETQKRELEAQALEGIQIEQPEVEITDPVDESHEEAFEEDRNDEYFNALMPEYV